MHVPSIYSVCLENPAGLSEFCLLRNVQPTPYSLGAGVLFRGYSGQGMMLTTPLHLGQRLRMGGSILLLAVYVFLASNWTTLLFVWESHQ
jgi:hypothetical protein